MIRNVEPDPRAPDPGRQTLVSVRTFYTSRVLWICISCRMSVTDFVQPRCCCERLMVEGKA
jgi:hypothetical protein